MNILRSGQHKNRTSYNSMKNTVKRSIQSIIPEKIKWYLKYLQYAHIMKTYGATLKLPYFQGTGCSIDELWMIPLLKHVLKLKEGAFFDIGVNLGQTLVMLKSLELTRQYIGFEPNPTCLAYAAEIVRINQLPDCTILPVGLYTQDKILQMDLYSNDKADPSASLIEGFRPAQNVINKIYVPACRFESIENLLNYDKVAVIKIDVEGAELDVVTTLLPTIRQYRPVVLLEVLPVYTRENIPRLNRQLETERIFKSIDYSFYRLIKNRTIISSLSKIEEIGIHADLNQCDYVVAPTEMDFQALPVS